MRSRNVPDVVTGVQAPPAEEDRFGQSRLFGWLLALLRQLSLIRPVLLRIEDLQSADPSSRDFLRFLVQSARSERLALVVTVRLDELGGEDPVRTLLAELGRSPLVSRCPVRPLSHAEVRRQVAQLTGAADAELVDGCTRAARATRSTSRSWWPVPRPTTGCRRPCATRCSRAGPGYQTTPARCWPWPRSPRDLSTMR